MYNVMKNFWPLKKYLIKDMIESVGAILTTGDFSNVLFKINIILLFTYFCLAIVVTSQFISSEKNGNLLFEKIFIPFSFSLLLKRDVYYRDFLDRKGSIYFYIQLKSITDFTTEESIDKDSNFTDAFCTQFKEGRDKSE